MITHDPRTGTRNVGMYRMQKLDRARDLRCTGRSTRTGAPTTSPPTAGSRSPSRSGSTRSPRTRASAPLPKHIDEFMLAGFLRGEPVELVQAKTVDLEVPANAEIVLEGYVEQGRARPRRARSATTPATTRRPSRSRSSTLTRDDDAARRDLPVDRRRQAAAGGRLARQGDRADLPAGDPDDACRRSSTTTCRSRARSTTACIVSIRKALPGHAQKVMHAIWGLGMLSLTKCGRRRRRVGRRARLRGGLLPRRRERRPDARRAAHRGPARPPRPRADAPVLRRQDRDRRDRTRARRRARASGRRRSR